ncbi:MAG: hypothetical protein EOP53_23565 [Sphingobacteriales bacterium]|nr:MAG: hypothetical protein EOP53_23565 [Sphingobacteriales bacterium]
MNRYIQTAIRWPIGCLIFFVTACDSKPTLQPIVTTTEDSIKNEQRIDRAFANIKLLSRQIKNGDLVTRTGNDFTSESLRNLCIRDKTYSHCGIASIENDTLFIYHAMGGEWNPDEKLRRDTWKVFAEPYSNKGVGLFRFDMPDSSINHLIAVVQEYYKNELSFDMKFDLATDEKMYCAEFVYKSFVKATSQGMQFNKSRIGNFEFVGPDDIFLHPLCKRKDQIVYK